MLLTTIFTKLPVRMAFANETIVSWLKHFGNEMDVSWLKDNKNFFCRMTYGNEKIVLWLKVDLLAIKLKFCG